MRQGAGDNELVGQDVTYGLQMCFNFTIVTCVERTQKAYCIQC